MNIEFKRFLSELHLLKANTQSIGHPFNVLHVTHRGGGGTEFFIKNLISKLREKNIVSYILRPSLNGDARIDSDAKLFPYFQDIELSQTEKLRAIVDILGIKYIHVHNLFGYSDEIIDTLISLSEVESIKLVVTIHDYYGFCPSLNLRFDEVTICNNYCIQKCKKCKGYQTWGGGFSSQDGEQRIESFGRLLERAAYVTVPSVVVKDILKEFFPKIKIDVIPHDESYLSDVRIKSVKVSNFKKDIVHVAVLGNINFPKGSLLLENLASYIKEEKLPILISLIGSTDAYNNLIKYGVNITGGYNTESEALELMEILNPTLVYIPSVWPETYCYTLSLALRSNFPVIANALGAQGERLGKERGEKFLIKGEIYSNPKLLADFFLHFDEKCAKPYEPQVTNCLVYYRS